MQDEGNPSSTEPEFGINIPPKFTFALIDGPCAGTSITPKTFYLTVGRTRTSKLHIKDGSVSEKHADISWNGQAWLLRDTGSSNGTWLNDRKLQPNGQQSMTCLHLVSHVSKLVVSHRGWVPCHAVEMIPLKHGDKVQFGESVGNIEASTDVCI